VNSAAPARLIINVRRWPIRSLRSPKIGTAAMPEGR